MGYYIDQSSKGVPLDVKGKAYNLIISDGAIKEHNPSWPPPKDKVLVCVVNNGPFEAAAIAYNQDEFDAFNDSADYRPKIWLLMDRSAVIKCCPHVEPILASNE